MNWHLIESGANTGDFNMDFDMQLVKSSSPNDAFLRLYRWEPYCISLGVNQSFNDISIKNAADQNIDVVKRPTGGRAILHAEEITYSVVLPYTGKFSARELYQKISIALIGGLEAYNPILSESELESIQPNFREVLQAPSGVICFGSMAKNEVKFKGKKIIGSAQRKLNNVILQHGSILCGSYHKNIVDFVKADDNTKQLLADEISDRTIEIETILQQSVDYERLSKCLIEGFEDSWQIKFERNFSACEHP